MSVRHSKKENFLLDGASNEAVRSISKHRNPKDKCSAFLSAFSEFNSFFGSDCVHDISEPEDLINLVEEQNRLVNEISDLIGVDGSSLQMANLSELGAMASRLIAERAGGGSEEVLALAGHVDKVVESNNAISRLISDMDAESTDDVLVSVKLAVLPQSYRFHQVLTDIGFHNSERDRHLGLQMTVAVELSKDLAYNYDRSGSIWDRERLFVRTLPFAMDFTLKAWLDLFSATLPSPLFVMDQSVVAKELERLRSVIVDCDMGYDDKAHSRSVLLERIAASITPRLLPESKSIPQKQLVSQIFAARLERFDEVASEAWTESANALIDKIFSMPEDQRKEYLATEGKNPMSLGSFWETIESRSDRLNIAPLFSPSMPELLDRASKQMISIWGLSDTICKVRNVNQ